MGSTSRIPELVAPKVDALLEICARLSEKKVPFALGGSGLLAALGLAEDVRDWDLTTDASALEVERALAGLGLDRVGPNGPFHTEKLFRVRAAGMSIDVMSRLAIASPAGVCRLPTIVVGTWCGVPVCAPEVWLATYALLGREDKAQAIGKWIRQRRVVNTVAMERLLAQPLPLELARWLRTLAPAAST